ncbi:MAG: M20/M25/M40 family metallo-hydrolase [Cyanobacteria bacterium P01_F01_bin.150]
MPSQASSSTSKSSPWPMPPKKLKKQVIHAITEDRVMAHVRELSINIGARPTGSEEESQAADYVATQLQQWGYDIEHQPFKTTLRSGESVLSSNIIATRPGSEQWLIVGGHLDSVADSSGAVDNASGIAALLETARLLSEMETHHTLIFIGFGAEEEGSPMGSDYYVQSLNHKTEQIVAMLNIDAIGAGRYPYVHAGAKIHLYALDQSKVSFTGGASWVRDLSVQVASVLGHEMRIAPPTYWNGYTGPWSDHYAFVLEDVPVAYFEAWDWHSSVDSPWWGQETSEGDISNTPADTFARVIPRQVEQITEVVAGTAIAIATHQVSSAPSKDKKDLLP